MPKQPTRHPSVADVLEAHRERHTPKEQSMHSQQDHLQQPSPVHGRGTYLSSNNASREIFISVLDPYALLDNPWVGFAPGQPYPLCATVFSDFRKPIPHRRRRRPLDLEGYGHLVAVNDTRVTLQDAYSLHPQVAIDSQGNTHIAWMDGRSYG